MLAEPNSTWTSYLRTWKYLPTAPTMASPSQPPTTKETLKVISRGTTARRRRTPMTCSFPARSSSSRLFIVTPKRQLIIYRIYYVPTPFFFVTFLKTLTAKTPPPKTKRTNYFLIDICYLPASAYRTRTMCRRKKRVQVHQPCVIIKRTIL